MSFAGVSEKIPVTDELYREDFNCVVCFEPLVKVDIFQCCKGEHNVCGTCVKKISPPKCPIDRSEGAFVPDPRRKRMFDKMLVTCPHRFCGVDTFEWLMLDHISECVYRSVKCPFCDFSFTDGDYKNDDDVKEIRTIEDAFGMHYGSGKCVQRWEVKIDDTLTHPIAYEKNGANRVIIYPTTQTLVFLTSIKGACKLSLGRMYKVITVSYSLDVALKPTQTMWIGVNKHVETKVPQFSLWKGKVNESMGEVVFVPPNAPIFLLPFKVGQILDVLDTQNKWLEAEVKTVDETTRRVFVHYVNWSQKWDEWLPFTSVRIAPNRTHTVGPNIVNRVVLSGN